MSEIRSIVSGATSRSLVLVDEICRGTETAKGTCIAGSIVETLDEIGCLGIISTHLHGIFDLPLSTKNTIYKAMGSEYVDGQTKPTWKLVDGICRESLAFETAKKEGVAEAVIQRAEELYSSVYAKEASSGQLDRQQVQVGSEGAQLQSNRTQAGSLSSQTKPKNRMDGLEMDVESAITLICQKKLMELYKQENTLELPVLNFIAIAAREQPPPSTIGASCVYVMFRPDKKLYIGEVFPDVLIALLFNLTSEITHMKL